VQTRPKTRESHPSIPRERTAKSVPWYSSTTFTIPPRAFAECRPRKHNDAHTGSSTVALSRLYLKDQRNASAADSINPEHLHSQSLLGILETWKNQDPEPRAHCLWRWTSYERRPENLPHPGFIYFKKLDARSHSLSRGLHGDCSCLILATPRTVFGVPLASELLSLVPGITILPAPERVRARFKPPSCTAFPTAGALLLRPLSRTFVSACGWGRGGPRLPPTSRAFAVLRVESSVPFCWAPTATPASWIAETHGFSSSPSLSSRRSSCLSLASAFSRSSFCRWKLHVDSYRRRKQGCGYVLDICLNLQLYHYHNPFW